MTDKEFTLDTMRRYGKQMALDVQAKSNSMTGTELNTQEEYIPEFLIAKEKMNMLDRDIGFVCKSSAGRVVKLIQPYNSNIYTQEPEELAAHWGFVWSDDPKHAKPFVAISTSPYMERNCCTENDNIYRSKINYNTFSPSTYPEGWEKVDIAAL